MDEDEHPGTSGGEQPRTTGVVRLTYRELGGRLGISADAGRVLARRRGWQRVHPNRPGASAVVLVPEDELAGEQWRQDRAPPAAPRTPPDVRVENPARPVDDRVEKAEQLADKAEQRAIEADRRADTALAVAERTLAQLAAERARFADLQRDLDAAKETQRAAEGLADAERQRADDLRAQIDALSAEMGMVRRESQQAVADERRRADQFSE